MGNCNSNRAFGLVNQILFSCAFYNAFAEAVVTAIAIAKFAVLDPKLSSKLKNGTDMCTVQC